MAQLGRLRALTAEKRKDYLSAVRLYRQLLAKSPEETQLQWKLGQLLVASGDAESGFAALRSARQKTPELPQSELMVATILASSDGEDAESWFRKSVRAEHATEQNLLEYARWLLRLDRLEYVGKMLAASPAKWKSHRDVVFVGAIVDRSLGKMESSETNLKRILADDPNDLEAADQLALVLIESKDASKRKEAKRISEENLQRTPKLQRSIATKAWIEFRLGSLDVADRMFKTLHQTGSISPQTAFYIASYLESREQQQEARTFYRLASGSKGFFPQRRSAKAKIAQEQ